MSGLDLRPRPLDGPEAGPPMSATAPAPRRPVTPPPAPPIPARSSGGDRRTGLVAVAVVAALAGAAVATPIALWVDPAGDATTAVATTSSDSDPDDAIVAQPAPADSGEDDPSGATSSTPIDVPAVAAAVSPSVVRINVSTTTGAGTGSGVVFDDGGHIVTNNHVVGDATTVTVTLPDGRDLDAEVVGTDPTTDLAVVRVDDADLAPVPVATEPPEIGSAVVAIGSPFGLDGSVTAGIVSALNREVASSALPLTGLVQTDAAINPGNSGGALVNGDGELVGINTAIASSGGGSDGIGFAIDTVTLESVANDLISTGRVERSWLGVAGSTTRSSDGQPTGARVEEVVPGSPAASIDLQPGDRIVSMDGEEVDSFTDLAARLARLDPGTEVTLTLDRNGTDVEVDVTLGEAG